MIKEYQDRESISENSDLWLVPYADMMTILTLFFLSLYGFAIGQRRSGFERSLIFIQRELTGNKETLQELDIKAQEAKIAQDVERELSGLDKSAVAFSVDSQRFRVTLASNILFDPGSAALKPDAVRLLKTIADSLKQLPNSISVEGHTDATPMAPGGAYPSNWELSVARAFSVIDLFMKEGIPAERCSALGFAANRPLAPNDTAEGRAKNRRIEISLQRQNG